MLLGIITFILILGVLIFVHELGHFWAAKKNGVRVEEFCLGFPPRIFKIKRGQTIYAIGLIPFGGFVRIYGEDGSGRREKDSFAGKSVWRRAKIISAGVLMNVVLAFAVLAAGYMTGLPAAVGDTQPINNIQIVEVLPDTPAARADLRVGDILLTAHNQQTGQTATLSQTDNLLNFLANNRGQTVMLGVKRGADILNKEIFVREAETTGQGPLGIAVANMGKVSFPWYRALGEALVATITILGLIVVAFAKILATFFTGGASPLAQVSGPVGIYSLSSQAAQMGLGYVLQFSAILSLHLAVINILPLPALDGGRLLFLLIEKIKQKPINRQLEQKIHATGFLILILLMLLITFKDFAKLFHS
ncbi:MAG: RIP metalloprotease RseP [Candidatus Portnoybacteria bacterium CG10_big_fil_rev_8_21_14_0_10_44_7]|uniref:Zinc metalloprotease n=1 Tax=Candidatus Portnoybacteria bacterium CG10_big_fil_rev_8_21_14_0_10_44_7 TaxID=1974816 RepID=A0A2M8KIG0_9BACT|nr:MAG: RIP metalloprotease RseP [Candidatus Portnoybacteria bacterium CG10_big_fil_rev_8_21_14_0_10_44_7]